MLCLCIFSSFAVTLDSETKAAANIPQDARFFAWCYPVVDVGTRLPSTGEGTFLQYGGYLYFDDSREAIATNGVAPAALGTLGLMFVRVCHAGAQEFGGFQEITLKALSDKGATHFAWMRPEEFADEVASADGCFVYKFRSGGPKYFPVVAKPVFTPDMLQEELDETEAWVVIRTALPTVERPVIFSKDKSFMENMENSGDRNLAVSADNTVSVVGDTGSPISYAEWQQCHEPATLAKPWIIHVVSRPPPAFPSYR
ncbi:unnamed protein product [Prorocentrum cordatum]|uniref:Uncharacterized protein n=1 Tax=Prorocentrum cordatum TaxID=2364126 RepID=A0ABN9UKH7_9DINO|nr:unnamed protein product [Polarella glacialis]